MKTKNTKSVENQALDLLKSLESTIADCKKYTIRNFKQSEEVKEYMKKKHSEMFLNEFDNHDSIVMEFSMKKNDEERLAKNLKKSIEEVLKNFNKQ
jgi:molecular chaperone GrpE (heat shock protein)